MVIYCRILKKYVFQLNRLKVYWSKRGHYTATSKAGAGPGLGNGELESQGATPTEAVNNLRLALIARREELEAKISDVNEALTEIKDRGYNAKDLLLLPKEGEV